MAQGRQRKITPVRLVALRLRSTNVPGQTIRGSRDASAANKGIKCIFYVVFLFYKRALFNRLCYYTNKTCFSARMFFSIFITYSADINLMCEIFFISSLYKNFFQLNSFEVNFS